VDVMSVWLLLMVVVELIYVESASSFTESLTLQSDTHL